MSTTTIAKSQANCAQLHAKKHRNETQAKMQYRQADVAFEIEKQKAEAQVKAQLMHKI